VPVSALVVVWRRAVLNGLGGWLGWTPMNDRLTHHQDVVDPGLVWFSVLAAFSASAVLLVQPSTALGADRDSPGGPVPTKMPSFRGAREGEAWTRECW
jgi:hypothetical protein